jgi:methylated-DNA-[protein]-cysteine S-methyltransferase
MTGAMVAPIDRYATLDDDGGRVFVAYSPLGVSALRPAKDAATFEAWFRTRIGRPLERAEALPTELASAIQEHLHVRDCFIPLDLRASTDFERKVLLKTRTIPWGETRTYAWIAREIGEPGAAKDVGVALSENPILHLIPCHRVVRSDGSLAGYAAGGVRAKRRLLLREGYAPAGG